MLAMLIWIIIATNFQLALGLCSDLDVSVPKSHILRKRSSEAGYVFKDNRWINGFSEIEKNNIICKHNDYRRTEGAADMQIMKWSDELENLAQHWANQCEFAHNPNLTTSKGTAGSSAAIRSPDYNEMFTVQFLYEEKEFYDFQHNNCSYSCHTYKQIVWSSSNEVGCGINFCPTLALVNLTDVYKTVCLYLPAGNQPGLRPYVKGPACSLCPNDMKYCIDGLCSATAMAGGGVFVQAGGSPILLVSFYIIATFIMRCRQNLWCL